MSNPLVHAITTPEAIASALVAHGKSILAADESPTTAEKRLTEVGIAYSSLMMHRFRSYAFGAEGLFELVGGVILHVDTLGMFIENMLTGTYLLNRGVLPGCKVDTGLEDFQGFPGQKRTKGLLGLEDRLETLKGYHVRFAKARSVYKISDSLTKEVLGHNARWQATYAAICLAHGIVPIVEPEVLADGTHTIQECQAATTNVLDYMFSALTDRGIPLNHVVLKPNMVTPGLKSGKAINPDEVADATLAALGRFPRSALRGIAFLSGGLSPDDATDCLRAINRNAESGMTYTGSFGRASQKAALEVFSRLQEEPQHVQRIAVQNALLNRLRRISRATYGLSGF
ncbi:fructose-bisphosphate aldolase class I [Candidatus Woesebacteria bacterium]|jgi:fructose-bisphosphate aldolase class I|nr:fructose-bisphosphate aldolase class I [Candidatus Woesebacteria bacterium]